MLEKTMEALLENVKAIPLNKILLTPDKILTAQKGGNI
jgi:hypothetical protein